MSDVFISYAREEAPRAEDLAHVLEESGYSVWWDRQTSAGASWASDIEQQLDEAKCVVVMWSTNSVGSEWVMDEAAYAREQRKLIPVLIDEVEPPLGFQQYQALRLTDSGGIKQLLRLIARMV